MAAIVPLCSVLPEEILEVVWDYLPARTRWTARKDTFECHYGELLADIPRIDAYLMLVVRHSRAYVFGLVMAHKRRQFYQLRRWTDNRRELHASYLACLRAHARLHGSYACLALAQDPETRNRPRAVGRHRDTWTV
jgi:hypothetical protein